MSKGFDISIVVTCHSEGILVHKTLLSIERALHFFSSPINYEIILHLDNPSEETARYSTRAKKLFKNLCVYTNSFGDPGTSRDFCIKQCRGKYISLIDGDDLMSQNWLCAAFTLLENKAYGDYIAHSAMTIEFGGFNSIVEKYGSLDNDTDSLLNVWSARWNSIIFAPSSVLQQIGYPHNKPGYGYEDWLISCTFIENDINNILVPETVMFVRRKESDSVWDTMRSDWLVLPSHPILSFEYVRKMPLKSRFLPGNSTISDNLAAASTIRRSVKTRVKQYVKNTPIEAHLRKAVRKYRHLSERYARSLSPGKLPDWLLQEWRDIHNIERQIFPSRELISNPQIYHSITELHYRIGGAYHKAVQYTRHNNYDYILFVPWLTSGGADSFAINYANAAKRYQPNKRVAVVATMQGGAPSAWKSKLDGDIDFIPLNDIFSEYNLEPEHQNRVIEQFIENCHAEYLHIINSIAGYDFVRRHKKYMEASGKKVIVTSFSESTDETGRVFGFSHTHVPYVYEQAIAITTDNSVVKNMWMHEYGFAQEKLLLHRPMIDVEAAEREISHSTSKDKNPKHVLWAARLAPEKLPQLVALIANKLPDVNFDMYGTPDKDFDITFLQNLPSNVSYKGSFNGFFTLPLERYGAYLYTSLFDGLPNALVEASVARLPIVASDAGGISDFVTEDTGILVQNPSTIDGYVKAIRFIIDNPLRAKELSDNAYESLLHGYSPDSHYASISDMLNDLKY